MRFTRSITHPARRLVAVVVATVTATALAACQPLPTPLPGLDGRCEVRWGSLPERELRMAATPVVDVRSGSHGCFDRLVVDLGGPVPAGWDVRYVDQVRTLGKGDTPALRGGAQLQVAVLAPAYTPVRQPTYQPADRSEVVGVSGFRTFRQVVYLNSFEGRTSFGVGVRARLPVRVFSLDGPDGGSRVVIDVAHSWS